MINIELFNECHSQVMKSNEKHTTGKDKTIRVHEIYLTAINKWQEKSFPFTT